MIVIGKMKKDDSTEKLFIRDQIFYKADSENKKGSQVNTSTIGKIITFHEGTMNLMDPKEWVELAQNSNFWTG